MAQHARVCAGEKVAAFDQHVGRDGELHAGGRREQRAVVADAEHGAAGPRPLEVVFDQVEFGEHPAIVPMICTPSAPSSFWRSAGAGDDIPNPRSTPWPSMKRATVRSA